MLGLYKTWSSYSVLIVHIWDWRIVATGRKGLQQRGRCLEIDTASRKTSGGSRWSQRSLSEPSPWSGWWVGVMEDILRKYEKIICRCLHAACRSRLELNNFSVSGGRVMGNSKASLEGSITSIAACSFQTSTAFFYWLLSTRPSPPLHIDRLYSCFTYLHLSMSFLVCLWLEGLAMSQSWLAFRAWVPTRTNFCQPLPNQR